VAKTLKGKQMRAAILLAQGCYSVEVAKAVGISAKTMSLWLNHSPEFRALVKAECISARNEARTVLAGIAYDAIRELRLLLTNSENEAIRLKAAQYVIDKLNQDYEEANAPEHSSVSLRLIAERINERSFEKTNQ
jgi:hypothetical protein